MNLPLTGNVWLAIAGLALAGPSQPAIALVPEGRVGIRWTGSSGTAYDLQTSDDLSNWRPVSGYPLMGANSLIQDFFAMSDRCFFRVATAANRTAFFFPETRAYQSATGISEDAAAEIDQFLRMLRSAGVEPALFWVGGDRYGSISGSSARAVIGGTGTVSGTLGTRTWNSESFTGSQTIRFDNPLRSGSKSRIGLFAGASVADDNTFGELISSGTTGNPRGPSLSAAWSGGNFRVFNQTGSALNQAGFGGYATAGAFLPYLGGAYDGYFTVLCGIGKSLGSRENPLRYYGMPQDQFPNNEFVNDQAYAVLGATGFSGKFHFAVMTADDLTENQRAYELVSIPRRCGFGEYGMQTAVAFLGDSITYGYNDAVWNSDSYSHKAGGQWNRNCLALLGNATGEGNDAQIQYYEKGARFALDPRTWNHLFYVCGSGGHYPYSSQVTENPLTQHTLDSIEAWVNEYHDHIAVPAAVTGATVVQMTYIYGCPQKFSSDVDSEIYRAFADQVTSIQKQVALSAGFAIFDAYAIPQLHQPIPAFYDDNIHPNAAGNRLLAQEFAATVANPGSRIPRSLSRPLITGTAKQGTTLISSRGSWAFTPVTYAYQWMRDATDIPGAAHASYILQSTDIGSHLSCRVTASNSYGAAERTSPHTTLVIP